MTVRRLLIHVFIFGTFCFTERNFIVCQSLSEPGEIGELQAPCVLKAFFNEPRMASQLAVVKPQSVIFERQVASVLLLLVLN